MHLLDLSHTSHTRARTGIQRVARSLYQELVRKQAALPVTWDPYAQTWRELQPWERANLHATAPGAKRGSKWPWPARLRGRLQRWRGPSNTPSTTGGLIVPELFSANVAQALPHLKISGPRIAIFHDAIALKLPEISPKGTVARFPFYLQELLGFDGIAAVSEESRQALLDYWRWLGVSRTPPVVTIPLGLDLPSNQRSRSAPTSTPVILCVGSIEGRKNQITLLEAAEKLWQQGRQFELHMIGMAQAQTGQAVLAKIRALQAAGSPLRYAGAVDESALQDAYAQCSFTVYPSLMEGFGLPILESLAHGKPCICSGLGALGESARPGGTLMLSKITVPTLSTAMDQLLQEPARIEELAADARNRTYRTWPDYANDLLDWMKSLP